MDGIVADQGAGLTPLLELDGFSGPLERLLTLARTQQIDLARIPLADFLDQLAAALQHAPPATPLGQKGDWVVMASWLLQLRSLLLLPAGTAAQQAAETTADHLRAHLAALAGMRALASWLDRRPLLGRDVFARGQPEALGLSIETAHEIDVVAFLWASLTLFDDAADGADTTARYRPRWLDLHAVPEARDRILRLLEKTPDGGPLGRFLPPAPAEADTEVRRRSAWTTTFAASLDLAKQGELVLAQDGLFLPIQLRRASTAAPAGAGPMEAGSA